MMRSRLDNDLYIFTMWYAMEKLNYGNIPVEYTFVNRSGEDIRFLRSIIEDDIEKLCSVPFELEDIHYLEKLHFFGKGSMDTLFDDANLRKLKRKNVNVYEESGELKINIKGPWRETIWFEVPILSIISNSYHKYGKNSNDNYTYHDFNRRVWEKHSAINEYKIKVADFGTRRRASYYLHDYIIDVLKKCPTFVGTSNVYLARKHGIKPIGTMAHQWLQFFQYTSLFLEDFQKEALEAWMHVYRGNLGIALTDVIGIDTFLNDFDTMLAKLYDGVRHDSGDPYEFGEKVINHYKKLGIDPKTKTIVFSDSLNMEKSNELNKIFKDRINISFGIGTHITNDCGYKPLSIVIKMTKVDNKPVAKISDEPNKAICDDTKFIDKLKKIFMGE